MFRSGRAMTVITASRHHAVRSSNAAQEIANDPTRVRISPAIGQNPRQHRECRDAHGRADEQHERQSRRAAAEMRMESQARAPRAGKAPRYSPGWIERPLWRNREECRPDFETHQEHEQHEPELAERVQLPEAIGGKQAVHGWGETLPSRDGPSRIPAAMSPITSGCPANRNAAAITGRSPGSRPSGETAASAQASPLSIFRCSSRRLSLSRSRCFTPKSQ